LTRRPVFVRRGAAYPRGALVAVSIPQGGPASAGIKLERQCSEIGFFALAFIAGFNVDKFVDKIEDVARAVWGIEKSRSAQARASESSETSQANRKETAGE
jgi:hypothetical protein